MKSMIVLLLLLAACATPPRSDTGLRPTPRDFASAMADGSGIALDFEDVTRMGGWEPTISPDGVCEGEMRGRDVRAGRRRGVLERGDREATLAALRDAPFDALDGIPAADVMDGETVSLAVAIGGRRLAVSRQMDDVRAAELQPLVQMLRKVVDSLPLTESPTR